MTATAERVETRRLTPAEVLAGVRDIVERYAPLVPGHGGGAVGFDTRLDDPILTLTEEFDGAVVERYFGVHPLPPEWWQRVFEFGTVGGLCHALAAFVEVPVVRPATVEGLTGMEGGAFAAVRRALERAGADTTDLWPDTPLAAYFWEWPDVFRWELPRLAPGRVPPLAFRNGRLGRRVLGVLLGGAVLVAGLALRKVLPVAGAVVVALAAKVLLLDLLLAPLAARRRNWAVEFGGLYDFADLARAIAGTATHDP